MAKGDKSLEALRSELTQRQETLAGLRAEREKAQVEAQERVARAQIEQAIARLDAEIAVEKELLENQKNIDPGLVGTGVPGEGSPVTFVEPVDPEEVAKQIAAADRTEAAPIMHTQERGEIAGASQKPEGNDK